MRKLLGDLAKISNMPSKDAGAWLSASEDGVTFLKEHLRGELTILYASTNAVLIHGVLVPENAVGKADRKLLKREFIDQDDSWAIQHVSGGGEPDRVFLEGPLRHLGVEFADGEKLIFLRSFSGRSGNTPLEISQKLVHSLGLHFMPERNAWCRLNDDGDVDNVITIKQQDRDDREQHFILVTIQTKDLAKYMRLTNAELLYFFDFTRVDSNSFNGWSDVAHFDFDKPDLFYHVGVMGQRGSYTNGRMFVRPSVTYQNIVNEYVESRNPSVRQFAVFKAFDLRSRKVIEISADPDGLSNYFQPDSDLPLEMSPVFFRSEVLQRYKADPDKYHLQDRHIACRGAWSLETYDVNEDGQVHTYLVYIGRLPYKEQLYWQSFNELPKGGLSERAIATDFEGRFYLDHEPLSALKNLIQELDEKPPFWWSPRGESLLKTVHYPVTDSVSEWGNEILALEQLVNEGFSSASLRSCANSLGVTTKAEWGSLKLLEEVLVKRGSDLGKVRSLTGPLRNLRDLRNNLKGHASSKKKTMTDEAISSYGTFRGHFEFTADKVREALEGVRAILS